MIQNVSRGLVIGVMFTTIAALGADDRVQVLGEQPGGGDADIGNDAVQRIVVDCDAGDTLDGLPLGPAQTVVPAQCDGDDDDDDDSFPAEPVSPLIVEIYGHCTGNLVVQRNDVTLVGMGDQPEIAGASDAAGDPVGATIAVRHAFAAEIRDLAVSGGTIGVDSLFSVVKLDGVTLESNLVGYRAVSSLNEIRNSVVRANDWGVANLVGDRTTVRTTLVVGNAIVGLLTRDHGTLSVIDVELSENGAAFSSLFGSVLSFGGQSSISPGSGGLALGADVQFQGRLQAANLTVRLSGAARGRIAVGGYVEAAFALEGASTFLVGDDLVGDIVASELSQVVVASGGSANTVMCTTAAESVCIGDVESSNCPGCSVSKSLDESEVDRLRSTSELALPPALLRTLEAGEWQARTLEADQASR